MKKTPFVLLLVLCLSGCTYANTDWEREIAQQSPDAPPIDCRMKDFTVEYLQGVSDGGNIDYEITQEYVDELNRVPHCKDFCKQQLEYSKKYNDWFAKDDLRETCKSVGIMLPN